MQREHPALNYLGGKGVSLDSILRQRKAVQDALIQTRTQQKTVKRRCDCCLISLISFWMFKRVLISKCFFLYLSRVITFEIKANVCSVNRTLCVSLKRAFIGFVCFSIFKVGNAAVACSTSFSYFGLNYLTLPITQTP